MFPASPWGENTVEPTPKLETGWANFDSSFEEPIVTNGDIMVEQVIKTHDLLSDVIELNTQDSTLFESHEDTISPIKNLTSKNCVILINNIIILL